ncbi:MAG: NADH-quinone oxidoreductase subunit NuoE [Desulfobacterales bacterium]|jgi:NADH-quinone oxidoreductase subunit E|nr:NADH-quinone oxidoreductase subunit NuoE [Desulfobacterales bacterium]
MLSEQEKKEIEVVAGHYPIKRAAGIEALKIVQKHRGWISDEVLSHVADALEMSPTDLDAVATFYNFIFRRPVGRHVILVCNSVSCWIMGYDTIVSYLKDRLGIGFGETTGDGRFTLLPNVCLGACDRAPVMMIDDQLYVNLDAEKIDKILGSYD